MNNKCVQLYLEVTKGMFAYFIDNHDYLQPQPKDTEKDAYFTRKAAEEWREKSDVFVLGTVEYIVQFRCEVPDKLDFMQAYHWRRERGLIRGVSFNE